MNRKNAAEDLTFSQKVEIGLVKGGKPEGTGNQETQDEIDGSNGNGRGGSSHDEELILSEQERETSRGGGLAMEW